MDKSIYLYKLFTTFCTKGIPFTRLFDVLGFSKVYIYGLGEFGKYVKACLKDEELIVGVSDQRIEESEIIDDDDLGKIMAYRPDEIPKDQIPIIVTAGNSFAEIRASLESYGICAKRIYSLTSLLLLANYSINDELLFDVNKIHEQFLIVGTNFDNKGSQAMTFVAMNEIKQKYPDAVIWICPNYWVKEYENKKYRAIFLEDGYTSGAIVSEIIPHVKAIIDVSGYALSSRYNFGKTDRTMTYLRMAYDYNIPFFLMPQSFGPLNYPNYKLAELKVLLSSCKEIFAREQAGYDLIVDLFELNNVMKSYDMVLQSKPINKDNIYRNHNVIEREEAIDNAVAIIPNKNLCFYIDEKEVVLLYEQIINKLIGCGKYIYVIPHSGDNALCEKITVNYKEDKHVIYYKKEIDCIGFEELISSFEFIIAARYHSIVHAYKQNIPCIILGWADKYNELAELLQQQEFLIDIRDKTINVKDNIELSLSKMLENKKEAYTRIQNNIKKIRDTDCFDVVWEKLNG